MKHKIPWARLDDAIAVAVIVFLFVAAAFVA
jgi:hypothetical protein